MTIDPESQTLHEVGFILLLLVSVYKVPFYYWYILGVHLGVQEI